MTGSSDKISLAIFAILAVFVIWKLRSVLGTRPNDEPPRGPFAGGGQNAGPGLDKSLPPTARGAKESAQILQLPTPRSPQMAPQTPDRWKGFAEPGSAVWSGLDAIAAGDADFDPANFSRGAVKAYELVLAAFAADDRDTLRNLLSPEVFDSFDKEIETAQSRGETRTIAIVSVDPARFEDARVVAGSAQITVRFAAKLISATRNAVGAVVQGDAEKIEHHLDDWTFARSLESSDPNWRLISTHPAG